MQISQAPEFYDKLLDVLVDENGVSDGKQSIFDSTVPQLNHLSITPNTASNSKSNTRTNEDGSIRPDSFQAPVATGRVVHEGGKRLTERPKLAVLESLEGTASRIKRLPAALDQMSKVAKKKSNLAPILLMVASLAFVIIHFSRNDDVRTGGSRIHLLVPRSGQATLTQLLSQDKFRRAVQAFQRDDFESYSEAQNDLVEIAEGDPKNKLAFSTLCLTYRELWPYAFQDSADLAALARLTQKTKTIDPGGLDGATCDIVQLILTGHMQEAKTQTETWLQDQPTAAVLYDLRGEIFVAGRDDATAIPYFEKARTLWPNWLKSYVSEARSHVRKGEFAQAHNLYETVLQRSPHHAVAKIEWGLMEFEQFQQIDKAYDLISSGLNGGSRLPPDVASRGYFGQAEIFENRGQRRKALASAEKAFSLNPANLAAREMVLRMGGTKSLQSTGGREQLFVGDQYAKAGDCLSAQAEYRAVFDSDPKNGVAAMKAAQCLWQLNQSQDAIEWLNRAMQAEPKLVSAYVTLADYYSQRFDFYAATKALERAQTISPRSYEIFRGFALVELRRNNFKGAAAWAQKALQLYDADINSSILMSRAQLGLGQFTEAQRYDDRAIEMDVNNVEAQSLRILVTAKVQGVEAGVHYAQELINTYPYVADYRMALVDLFMQDERWAAAESTLKQVLSIDQNNKPALLKLGKVLQQLGRPNDALEVYLKAAILDPSDAHPIFQMGLLYLQLKKYKDAGAQFTRVLKINPKYPRAHLSLGRTALEFGDTKLAADEAKSEKALNPEMADAYVLAAEVDYKLGQFTNCAGEYQRAIQKQNQDTIVYVRLAQCYRRSGALDSALSILRQAGSRESGNPLIYKELGAVYQTKSMADEAIIAYNRYLTLMPNAPDRQIVETQLNRLATGSYELNGGELQ